MKSIPMRVLLRDYKRVVEKLRETGDPVTVIMGDEPMFVLSVIPKDAPLFRLDINEIKEGEPVIDVDEVKRVVDDEEPF